MSRPSSDEVSDYDVEVKSRLIPSEAPSVKRQDKHPFSIGLFIWSCLVILTFIIWDPLHFRTERTDSLLDGTLPSGGHDLEIKLAPFKFEPLPLGSVKPEGWMRDQLQLMADGLAGHLYDFYHVVRHSPWLGGHSEYASLNEGLPYWFNGLVPLAYGLDDARLKKQVLEVADEVLRRQWKDGWLGPESGYRRDIWSRFPLCLGLIQLVEAEPSLTDKVVPALYRFVDRMQLVLLDHRAKQTFWGKVRYPDMLVTLQWLYEKHPRGQQDKLLQAMMLLQRYGFDWPGYWTNGSFIFADLDTIKPAIGGHTFRFRHSHAVNVGQGLSAGAALYRFTKNESLLDVNRRGVNWTFNYHGDVAGSIIGDERESGLGPNRGSELCTASETLYSLSYLYQVIGDKEFADRCELAAFNAWPVSITADHWARQYLAIANDPIATRIFGRLNFWNAGFEALVYGLDTNYPCCTVNMPQGLPKFLSSSFVRVGDDGIGHAMLGPASVDTTTTSGADVKVSCRTNYPFGHSLEYTIQVSAPITLYVRVPEWSRPNSVISIPGQGKTTPVPHDKRTGMAPISLGAGQHTVHYDLEAKIRVVPRGNSSVAIYHGALLYALDIGETKTFRANTISPNVTYSKLDGPPVWPDTVKKVEIENTDAWNIGIDPMSLEYHTTPGADEPLPNPVFDYRAPPGHIIGKGCLVEWPMKNGLPDALPALPKGQDKRKCEGELTDVVLRPYASLKVHMAELPVVDLSTASASGES